MFTLNLLNFTNVNLLSLKKTAVLTNYFIHISTKVNKKFFSNTMDAWCIEQYNNQLVKKHLPIPELTSDNQIIIKIKAASLNPIDVWMSQGYGHEILSKWRQLEYNNWNLTNILCQKNLNNSYFPIIPGRDCSGEVVKVGSKVSKIRLNDEVIAVIPGQCQGTHAEYVIASEDWIALKPKTVTHVEACSLAFTTCTSWAALVNIAKINSNNAKKKRVLIHGGSGGMGTATIQLLRAWGSSKIVATCSKNNMDYVQKLGAVPIDYNSLEVKQQIIAEGPYEVILDCARSELSKWSNQTLGIWRNCIHISFVSPLLFDTDRYGIPMGLLTSFFKYLNYSIQPALEGKWFFYGFFRPNKLCLTSLSTLIDQKKIIPHVDKTYNFDEVADAYVNYRKFPIKGKSVISF